MDMLLEKSSSFPSSITRIPYHKKRCFSQSQRFSIASSSLAAAETTARKMIVPVLSPNEVMQKLRAHTHEAQKTYRAMYSSITGGITIDPAAMVVPLDDHMVHRGHGVFDTAIIAHGYLYELDPHLDRFFNSAANASIPPPFPRATIRDILVQTVASSGCKLGSLRYWLSAGPGGFNLSSSECKTSALYAVVLSTDGFPAEQKGVSVITSSIPIKSPQFATMKNVNYLPNALSKMEAESKGAAAGIWLDEEGFIGEGPSMNVAFVTSSTELLVPEFDRILSGCTARRTVALASKLVEEGVLSGVRVTRISPEEAKGCVEMMLLGSGVLITPVVEWDGEAIGNGETGAITLALRKLLMEDMLSGPSSVRTRVPYPGEV